MRTATTAASDLRAPGRRLDASYHASTGVRALHHIHRWAAHAQPLNALHSTEAPSGNLRNARRLDTLAEVCRKGGVFIPARFKRIYVSDPEHGVAYLTGSSIMQANPLEGAKLLSYRYTSNMDRLALADRMTLVTCSGTIGNSVYVNANFASAVGSPDLLRIVADEDKISSGYLFAFLSSPLGKALIEQQTYGAVVPHIEAHHVMDLPIPRLDLATEQRIHEQIEEAARLRVTANALLEQAQTRLFEACDLPRLTRREALTKGCWTFTVPRSQYGEFALTAWTYNPITQRLIARISERSHSLLGDIVIENGIFYGDRFARLDANANSGVMLLSQSDSFQLRPLGRWISKRSVANYTDYIPEEGTALIAAQGTMGDNELFGHCEFSHRNYVPNQYMLTEHILRVMPDTNKIEPGYLFAFLSSEYGFQMLRSTARGTKLLGFILELVHRLPVPRTNPSVEGEINSLVYRSYDRRADALAAEDTAQSILAEALELNTWR